MPDFPTHGDNFTTIGPVVQQAALDRDKYRKTARKHQSALMIALNENKRLRAAQPTKEPTK